MNTGYLGLGVTIMLCAATLGVMVYPYSHYYSTVVMLYGGVLGFLIAAIEIIRDVKRRD